MAWPRSPASYRRAYVLTHSLPGGASRIRRWLSAIGQYWTGQDKRSSVLLGSGVMAGTE